MNERMTERTVTTSAWLAAVITTKLRYIYLNTDNNVLAKDVGKFDRSLKLFCDVCEQFS